MDKPCTHTFTAFRHVLRLGILIGTLMSCGTGWASKLSPSAFLTLQSMSLTNQRWVNNNKDELGGANGERRGHTGRTCSMPGQINPKLYSRLMEAYHFAFGKEEVRMETIVSSKAFMPSNLHAQLQGVTLGDDSADAITGSFFS